jgi:hypothetical protein
MVGIGSVALIASIVDDFFSVIENDQHAAVVCN